MDIFLFLEDIWQENVEIEKKDELVASLAIVVEEGQKYSDSFELCVQFFCLTYLSGERERRQNKTTSTFTS